jgi:hypothetical protein
MVIESVITRGMIGRSRARKRRGFSIMKKYNMLCFLGTLIRLRLCMGVNHEDLGSYFVLLAIDK